MLLYKPSNLLRAACRPNRVALIDGEPLAIDGLRCLSNTTGVFDGPFEERSAR